MEKSKLTIERLRAALDYDPEAGILRWKMRLSNNTHVGDLAGTTSGDGYVLIGIDGCTHAASRLAWAHFHGEFAPDDLMVDHRDRNRSNNRIKNLRLATNAQNQANRGPAITNTTGFKGVYLDRRRNKYVASIGSGVRARPIRIGEYDAPEIAHAAYLREAVIRYGEFASAV